MVTKKETTPLENVDSNVNQEEWWMGIGSSEPSFGITEWSFETWSPMCAY